MFAFVIFEKYIKPWQFNEVFTIHFFVNDNIFKYQNVRRVIKYLQ